MPLTFQTYVEQVGSIIEAPLVNPFTASAPFQDANYNIALPGSIDYAENSIQRDLDLLTTLTTDISGTLTPSNRLFTLPTSIGTYLTLTEVALIISGVNQPSMTPVSREFLNACYPSNTPLSPTPSIPIYWAMYDQATISVGPAPDTNYGVKVVGTQRVPQLSATNSTNWLSMWLPDLYIAAAMIYWAGFQRDYGQSGADNPQTPIHWESVYQNLLKSASTEQARTKWHSVGGSSQQPSPVMVPQPRT